MPDRVVVFSDEQNVYNEARRAFFEENDHYTRRNTNPYDLAKLLTDKKPTGHSNDRILQEVRIYTGMPSPAREPTIAAAVQRRVEAWKLAGVTVITRPLRYLTPTSKGDQKGIDVAMAIDIVDLALADVYDVGILCCVDQDMHPVLEFVGKNCPEVRLEVSTWRSDKHSRQVRVAGVYNWNHRLGYADYQAVCDHTNYSAAPMNLNE